MNDAADSCAFIAASILVAVALGFALLRGRTREQLARLGVEDRAPGGASAGTRVLIALAVIVPVASLAATMPTTLGPALRGVAASLAMAGAAWPALPYVATIHDRGWVLVIGPAVLACELLAAALDAPLSGAILVLGVVLPGIFALIEIAREVRSAPGQGGGTFDGGPR